MKFVRLVSGVCFHRIRSQVWRGWDGSNGGGGTNPTPASVTVKPQVNRKQISPGL